MPRLYFKCMGKLKAVGLCSGGLDSILAAMLVKKQGFEVHLLHFISPYFGYKGDTLKKLEERIKELDMFFHPVLVGDDYVEQVLKNPPHGKGSAFNACIDCHLFMILKAKQFMSENEASFVFTGEVLGQRPMSQTRRSLNTIAKKCGLDGRLVRPLSAKKLDISIPEKEGVLNRHELMDICGRGRKKQLELAKELGLKEYPQPGGGCKFTDPNLVKRLNKFTEINPDYSWRDLTLLMNFRHLYIGDGYYLVLSRDQKDLEGLSSYFDMGITIMAANHVPSSTGLLINYSSDRTKFSDEMLTLAGRVVARYTKAFQLSVSKIEMCFFKDGKVFDERTLEPICESDLKRFLL